MLNDDFLFFDNDCVFLTFFVFDGFFWQWFSFDNGSFDNDSFNNDDSFNNASFNNPHRLFLARDTGGTGGILSSDWFSQPTLVLDIQSRHPIQ
jgi:hypothetical protein